MSKKSKHIHKYIRVNGKHVKIFKCAFPDCVFSLNFGQFELLLGRYGLCNGCNSQFIITEDNLNEDEPKCINCKFKSVIGNNISQSLNDNIEEITITDLDGFLEIKGLL
jgi:hypothetical protein